MKKKKEKSEAEMKKIESKILGRDETAELTPETIAIRKFRQKQSEGQEAVEKIKCKLFIDLVHVL